MPDSRMQDLLGKFGLVLEINDLCFDENGYCCLFFDDLVLNMELDDNSEQLFLYANVGNIPQEGQLQFYENLLEANNFYRGTGGATLGVDKASDIVSLIYKIPYTNLDFTLFQQMIENFVNVTESWTEKISQFTPGDIENDSRDLPGFPDQGIRV